MNLPTLADQLLPFLLPLLRQSAQGSGASAQLAQHELSGGLHVGVLADSQAPQFLKMDGSRTLTGSLSVIDGVQIDGVDISAHAGDPAAHHAPVTAGTLISVLGQQVGIAGGNQQYQVPVTGASPFAPSWTTLAAFAGAGLAFSSGQFAVGVANTGAAGLSVEADAVRLTSSSNPGAAASVLASDGSGYLSLVRLTLADRLYATLVETASGSLTLSPAGAGVLPAGTILKDLGDYNRKWRTLYAGELYVETLVAQDVMATIGGRVMVAPTSKLIADAASGAATIDVQHNAFAVNDYLYLAAAPGGVAQVEVMRVTGGPTTVAGGYRYTVTRNVDGSGVNGWTAGDAVVLLREGYIDLTATSTALNHLGPTITTYARSSTSAWNSLTPTTAQGNLRSFVDYGSTLYGFALGNNLTLTPSTGFQGMTADPTNGVRLFNTALTEYDGATAVLSLNQATGLDMRAYAVGGGNTGDARRKVRWMDALGGSEVAAIFGNTISGSDELYVRLERGAATQHIVQFDVTRSGYGAAQLLMNSYDGSGSRINLTATFFGFSGRATFTGSTFDVDVTSPWIRGALRIGGTAYANGSTAWHAGNDGSGSGLDADLLDGQQGSYYLPVSGYTALDVRTKLLTVDGIGSGIDADRIQGYGLSAAGAHFNGFTVVAGDGVMEIGRYLDFHESSGSTADFSARIASNGGVLSASGVFFAPTLRAGNASDLFSAKVQTDGNIHAVGAITSQWMFQVQAQATVPSGAAGYARITLRASDNALVAIMPSGAVRVLATN